MLEREFAGLSPAERKLHIQVTQRIDSEKTEKRGHERLPEIRAGCPGRVLRAAGFLRLAHDGYWQILPIIYSDFAPAGGPA